jgi:hypothetical protein
MPVACQRAGTVNVYAVMPFMLISRTGTDDVAEAAAVRVKPARRATVRNGIAERNARDMGAPR